jgi:hypothetical protein
LCVLLFLVGARTTELAGRVEGLGATASIAGADFAVATGLSGDVVEIATTAGVTGASGLLSSTAGGVLTRDYVARTAGLLGGLEDGLTTAAASAGGAFEGIGTTALGIGEVGAIEEVAAVTTEILGVIEGLGTTALRIGEIGGLEELLATADLLEWVVGLAVAALGLEWSSLHHLAVATGLGVSVQGTRFHIAGVVTAGLRVTGNHREFATGLEGGIVSLTEVLGASVEKTAEIH